MHWYEAPLIAEELYQHVFDPQRLAATAHVSPGRSLRTKRVCSAFSWVPSFGGHRYYTKKAVKLALVLLVEEYGVRPPLTEGYTLQDWLRDQVVQIHHLIRRSVKNSWERSYQRQRKRAMDDMETQPWFFEDRV